MPLNTQIKDSITSPTSPAPDAQSQISLACTPGNDSNDPFLKITVEAPPSPPAQDGARNPNTSAIDCPSIADLIEPQQCAPNHKYYMVSVGVEVGIFTDLSPAKESRCGVTGGRIQGCRTWAKAVAAYKQSLATNSVHIRPKKRAIEDPPAVQDPSSASNADQCRPFCLPIGPGNAGVASATHLAPTPHAGPAARATASVISRSVSAPPSASSAWQQFPAGFLTFAALTGNVPSAVLTLTSAVPLPCIDVPGAPLLAPIELPMLPPGFIPSADTVIRKKPRARKMVIIDDSDPEDNGSIPSADEVKVHGPHPLPLKPMPKYILIGDSPVKHAPAPPTPNYATKPASNYIMVNDSPVKPAAAHAMNPASGYIMVDNSPVKPAAAASALGQGHCLINSNPIHIFAGPDGASKPAKTATISSLQPLTTQQVNEILTTQHAGPSTPKRRKVEAAKVYDEWGFSDPEYDVQGQKELDEAVEKASHSPLASRNLK